MGNKGAYIHKLLNAYAPDVLCLQETWTKDVVSHTDYFTYRNDRATRGGGVITMVKKCHTQQRSDIVLPPHLNDVEVVKVNIGGKIDILNIYAPPGCKIRKSDLPVSTKAIVAGDFNAHHPVWSSKSTPAGSTLHEWAAHNDLLVANKMGSITRPFPNIPGGGTSPDVVFFQNSMILEEFSVIREDNKHGSDHRPLYTVLDPMCQLTRATIGSKKRVVWDFKSTDWNCFGNMLDKRIRKSKLSNDATANAKLFNNILHEVAAKFIRRRVLFKGKRRRKWKTSTPDSTKSKGIHLRDQLDKGNNFAFAFKKIKELQQDAGKDISVNNISDCDLPSAFLDLFVSKSEILSLEAPALSEGDNEMDICCDFTMAEIKAAIKNLKTRKAAGPDGVHNEMIKNFTPATVEYLLRIINTSWKTSKVPYQWKQGLIKPMFKAGKPRNELKSFRPITLTSVVGKLAERLVYDRLMHWLTKHSSLSPLQAGFRRGRNTCEQITVLVDAVVRMHMKRKRSVFLSFDFTAAFDRINHKILLLKLVKMGVPNVIIRWITDFLTNRKVRVEANGYLSEFRTLAKGVPQGSILGPLLYLIYVDDLCKILELEKETTTSALYADDTACVVSGHNMEEALSNAQIILDKVDQWCSDNDMALSVSKTCALKMKVRTKDTILNDTCNRELLFSRSVVENVIKMDYSDIEKSINLNSSRPMLQSGETILEVDGTPIKTQDELDNVMLRNIVLEDNVMVVKASFKTAFLLPIVDSVKYLGVHIDDRLTFHKQVAKIHEELKKGISLLQCLQPYDLDYKTLNMVKNLYVTARISYALDSFGWLISNSVDSIDFELRKVARLVTGCSRCTPRELLLWEADMLPFKRQIEKQTKIAYYRYKAMTWIPSTNRLASTQSYWAGLLPGIDSQRESQCLVQPDSMEPWVSPTNLRISNGCGFPKSANPAVDKEKFMSYIGTLPPVDMVINCDGSYSASGAAGAAHIAKSRSGLRSAYASRLYQADCSYRAEQHALKNAARHLRTVFSKDRSMKSVRIFTDSKSLLDELLGGRCRQRNTESLKILEYLRMCEMKVHLQFIPSHIGIEFHDEVDALAKEAAHNKNIRPVLVKGTYFSRSSHVKRCIKKDLLNVSGYTCYKHLIGGRSVKYPPGMERADEIRIANFRTGCHPLIQNWRKTIDCPFCGEPSSQVHLLQGCQSPKLDSARFKILGFSTLTGKWDRDRELIIANEIPNLEALFTLAWLPSLALIIRWMEQTSNLRLWK